ncbi:MAG: restriction endonuclease [Candidatus Nanohaloarchaea archaeon]|nr:restriction endonuclease [Candidatus Nanohaloarchaea archaeon]
MEVKDAHGGTQEYDPDKIVRSAVRAGFERRTAEEIESQVRDRAWEGINTRKLHSIVYEEMQDRDESNAMRYRLRESIADLNPNYHEFEKYMTKVLDRDGLETSWSPRPEPQGECSEHEIDVVAEVAGETFVVECKHHYHHHRFTGLGVPMRQWARLQDLEKGYELGLADAMAVDKAWVIVNTKLSDHAKKYAECRGVRMTAWDYPEGESLRALVERNRAYPITMLRPPHHVKVELSKRNILVVQELLELSDEEVEDLGIKEGALADLQRQAASLVD